jgi:hypothetical protein
MVLKSFHLASQKTKYALKAYFVFWLTYTVPLELILSEILERSNRSVLPMATAKRRPASQKNCLYIILILRAPIFPLKGKGNFSARLCADARTATRGRREYGSRAKNFLPLNPSIFCPLA